MSNQLSSRISLAYTGTNATNPPNIFLRNRAPTANDFQNVSIGDFWLYRVNRTTNNNLLYVLMGLAGNVADWELISGSSGATTSLTGNTGGVIDPLAGNINVVGDGTTITITGNPLTHTLTASLIGGGAAIDTIVPDSGINVVPNGSGNVSILGGNNIISVGTANTLTLDLNGTTNNAIQVGNASGSLTSLSVATNGQLPIGSTGSAPVIANLTAGTGISITNGAGSISIAATGTDITYPTDSGTATPSAGVLNILGSGIISTSGSGNTVTIASSIPSYSSGTFVPAITFGGAAVGITYATQLGYYTRIGSVLYFNLTVTLTSKGSSVGAIAITGMPVASSALNINPPMSTIIGNVTLSAGYTYIQSLITITATSLLVQQCGSAQPNVNIFDTNVANDSNFQISGFYFV